MRGLLGLTISLGVCSSHAITLPFSRRDAAHHSTSVNFTATSLGRSQDFDFISEGGSFYAATVFVMGQPYTVQLDTGSSDFWVSVAVDGWDDTGHDTSILYGDMTSAAGPIGLANVTFGDFSVEKQALFSAPGSNATSGNDQGLLGLGGHFQSNVFQALQNSSYNGDTLLDNIFSTYPNESNYVTFMLTRSYIGSTSGGIFTIAETVAEFSSISNTPQLPVFDVAYGAWTTLMDGVEVNGVGYKGSSSIVSSSQTVVLFDTGTAAATAPAYYVDAMYKDLPGAVFNGEDGYLVPCNSKVNISMVFGKHTYPIHPIDSVRITGNDDTTGSLICAGTFSYNDPLGSNVDFILGDAFLRNVYSLYDYGSWTTVGSTPPFMQILSITDPDKAWGEFDTMLQTQLDELFNALFDLIASGGNETTTVTVTETESRTAGSRTSVSAASTSLAIKTGTPDPVEDLSIKGAIADDTSSNGNLSQSDLNTLIRNSYVLIGLISGAILLILGLLASKFVSRGSQRGYRKVEYAIPPGVDKPYSAEAAYSDSGHRMSNPCSDAGH